MLSFVTVWASPLFSNAGNLSFILAFWTKVTSLVCIDVTSIQKLIKGSRGQRERIERELT